MKRFACLLIGFGLTLGAGCSSNDPKPAENQDPEPRQEQEAEPEAAPEPEPEPAPAPPPVFDVDFGPEGDALQTLYEAMLDEDYATFRGTLWPAQVDEAGEDRVELWFETAVAWAANVDTFDLIDVVHDVTPFHDPEIDPDFETNARIWFQVFTLDGDIVESAFNVVRSNGTHYVEWVDYDASLEAMGE